MEVETLFGLDYQTWWFIVVGVLFAGYAVLDGFDFGAGAWHLFLPTDEKRRIALNAVGPVWDGNEVWLITGGGALFAGFPEVYATLFSAMYIPLKLFLVFIIFRAVSIEFRSKEKMRWWRKSWDVAYCVSSIALSILLGVLLGNVLQGMAVGPDFEYQGEGFWEFLSPYSLMCGIVTLALFMMHGAIFLLIKTEDKLFNLMYRNIKYIIYISVLLFTLLTIWTLIDMPHLHDRLRENIMLFAIPVLGTISLLYIPVMVKQHKLMIAFALSSFVMVLMFAVTAIELYPTILHSTFDPKYSMDIYNSASSVKTLKIMMLIVAIGFPLIVVYTYFVYKVFSGKVIIDETSY